MSTKTKKAQSDSLVIAVSSRTLFNMEESNRIFIEQGIEKYIEHQIEKEEIPLKPGVAFPLVKALLELNKYHETDRLVEVIVASNVHPQAGLRIIKSIQHYNLDIKKSAFTGGRDVVPYLSAFETDLLLSRSETDTQRALDAGIPSALMFGELRRNNNQSDEEIRIAFDGDAVIFSEDSEKIYQTEGLEAFLAHEKAKAKDPMTEGPFAKFLRTLQKIQNKTGLVKKPFRIAIVTARGDNARERVLQTLRAWNIHVDEVFFLSGMPKAKILKAFNPHIFFDDQEHHVSPASKLVPSGRVPYHKDSELKLIMDQKEARTA